VELLPIVVSPFPFHLDAWKEFYFRQQSIVFLNHTEQMRKKRLFNVSEEFFPCLQSRMLFLKQVHEIS
jgi:hypothetical protein